MLGKLKKRKRLRVHGFLKEALQLQEEKFLKTEEEKDVTNLL